MAEEVIEVVTEVAGAEIEVVEVEVEAASIEVDLQGVDLRVAKKLWLRQIVIYQESTY